MKMPTALAAPIHVAVINGSQLRFFENPTSSAPDMPWHVADDLFVACGFTREMRQHFLRHAQIAFGDDLQRIATLDGPVTITPHAAAQALLSAASQVTFELRQLETAYIKAASDALDALAGDRPPRAKFEFVIMAARNSGIGGTP